MLHRHAGPAVAGSYLAGAVTGALTTAAGLFVLSGLLAPVPASARQVLAICFLVMLLIHRLGVVCLDLPQRAYQIPRETFRAAPSRSAFRFAFELGTGVRTFITSVSPYAIAVLLLLGLPNGLAAAALATAACALGYGLGRSVVVVSQSLRSTIAVEHPAAWLRAADGVALTTALAIVIVA